MEQEILLLTFEMLFGKELDWQDNEEARVHELAPNAPEYNI